MSEKGRIIAVGEGLEAGLPNLLTTLQMHGFDVVEAPKASDLPAVLEQNRGAVVLAYDPRRVGTAHEVLRVVRAIGEKPPVIVIVGWGTFEDYYELMCEGAYNYFEVTNHPEEIERSIRWAAKARAA
jgi:DNA-binding NtrC family response regulator